MMIYLFIRPRPKPASIGDSESKRSVLYNMLSKKEEALPEPPVVSAKEKRERKKRKKNKKKKATQNAEGVKAELYHGNRTNNDHRYVEKEGVGVSPV